MPLTLLRMFGGLEETHEAMREVFKSDFGLDPSGNIELRKEIAILPSVWESSRMQLKCQESRSESSRFQAWSTTAPRPELGKSGYAGCCVEAAQGRSLKDREIPSKSLIAAKLEQIEDGAPIVEDLREVTSLEDAHVEAYGAVIVLAYELELRKASLSVGNTSPRLANPKTAGKRSVDSEALHAEEWQWERTGESAWQQQRNDDVLEVSSDEDEDGHVKPLLGDGNWGPRDTPSLSLGEELLKTLARHMDLKSLTAKLVQGKITANPFSSNLIAEGRELLFTALEYTGAKLPVREKPEGQPFYLAAIEELLRISGDPDSRVFFSSSVSFAKGVRLGPEFTLPHVPAFFEKKEKWRRYDVVTTQEAQRHFGDKLAVASLGHVSCLVLVGGRAAFYTLGKTEIFMLVYVDELLWLVRIGENGMKKVCLIIFFFVLLGLPFSWHKFRGGDEFGWVGFELNLRESKLGLSIQRAQWLVHWLSRTSVAECVKIADVSAVLGGLSFALSALGHPRPFLGPVYAWVAVLDHRRSYKMPRAISSIFKFLAKALGGEGRLISAGRPHATEKELFRTDAKAEGNEVWMAGWALDSEDTKQCRWFSERLDHISAPWVFLAGEAYRQIASWELLATLAAVVSFGVPPGEKYGFMCSAATDNRGNSNPVARLLTTKFPLCVLLMELAVQLQDREQISSFTGCPDCKTRKPIPSPTGSTADSTAKAGEIRFEQAALRVTDPANEKGRAGRLLDTFLSAWAAVCQREADGGYFSELALPDAHDKTTYFYRFVR
ncbi:hypothetical protein AK812_SmicGene26002 [Symbiodinium microadriaticum]|uniref:Uncharacterized protein n=1 Tax=Symbiodinium microadriaticum TaxID=2951 RepID=A0A1Q9DAS9_SYMMI|nr:hypothetical protein AK812_SmicGene26002 [Symbiodinium microadriaticum]